MFYNYLVIAWRNLIRHKLYSLINLGGLAVGLTVCMLILIYVAHEHSFDQFHAQANQTFAVHEQLKMGGGESVQFPTMSYYTGPAVQQSTPAVTGYMRTHQPHKSVIIQNPAVANATFTESNFLFADADFFRFFTFELKQGNPATVLREPLAVVISQKMATKYFGTSNPVGKTLRIKTDSTFTYQVTGVAAPAPSNSSITFDFVASVASLKVMPATAELVKSTQLRGGDFRTYFRLKQAADTTQLQNTMRRLVQEDSFAQVQKFVFTALPDLHLKANFGDFTNSKYIKIFPLVAGLILLLALINYMSLTTARSTIRAKEIGVRQVFGANRKIIMAQFYVESTLFAVLAFSLAYGACYLLTPWFLNKLQLQIDTAFLYSPTLLLLLLGLLVFTILVAGSYPAFVLSGYQPVATLKGKMGKQIGAVRVRQVFTTAQFSISVGLMICGLVIDRQLYYFRHTETGINRENVVMIPITEMFGNHYQQFKREIAALPGVAQVATARYPMYKGYDMWVAKGKNSTEDILLPVLSVDKNFVPTLGIQWKVPPVSQDVLNQPQKIVVNELALAKLGLPANPVGSLVNMPGGDGFEVAGVVNNFVFGSLVHETQPLGLVLAPDTANAWGAVGGCLFARINPRTNLPTVLERMAKTYQQFDQTTPFTYTFLDDAFNAQYQAEDRLASIFGVFTGLTVLLACLGLFGLTTFTITQRTKEIGIRKVLGATTLSIVTLVSKNFLQLILVSIVVAAPVAWWFMQQWLQDFAHRITISWWIFGLAGGAALIIAFLTISFQAIKAALDNPVEALRNE
ncbi:ABC transporter permease [Adhaeribacter swui]|uniref:ABC transporter permease n=1 Tax=Adhaeribacter swui TaxID=2086471 RepID=A0A7G7G6R3_9BACT|nr:ABC transporter permease [Adhaeribacter swui]QNF32847.1 ABC transporter permease [Adhaeribacter swui]